MSIGGKRVAKVVIGWAATREALVGATAALSTKGPTVPNTATLLLLVSLPLLGSVVWFLRWVVNDDQRTHRVVELIHALQGRRRRRRRRPGRGRVPRTGRTEVSR